MSESKINPKYLLCKQIQVEYDDTDSIEKLWNIHNTALQQKPMDTHEDAQTLLDLKIHIAKKLFSDCIFCENRCHIDRNEKNGLCKVTLPRIASELIHTGEERLFVPSHTIFFSGCNFQCVFCQNYDISQQQKGLYIKPEQLAKLIEKRYPHSRNVNWVGGEPTPNVLLVLKTLKHLDKPLPQIWNSNIYCSQETLSLLNGVIDVFLADFKFGNNTCAEKLAKISNYIEIITRNLLIINSFSKIFIRHLVLPNHINCCTKPVLQWIKSNIPNTQINIMDQYVPAYQAQEYPKINLFCSKEEIILIKKYARNIGLDIYSDLMKYNYEDGSR